MAVSSTRSVRTEEPRGQGDVREVAAGQRPQGDMQGTERPGHHQPRQTLVQGNTPLRFEERGIHRRRRLGSHQQGGEDPGPCKGRGSVARADFEGAVRRGAAGDAGPRPEGAEARKSWEQVPAERVAQVRRMRQALLRPRSQERPVRLLHLRHPVQGGRRDVQRPLPERPQAGDVRGGEDQGADSERGDHRGAGDAGGRGDRRHGRRDVRQAGGHRGRAIRRVEAS